MKKLFSVFALLLSLTQLNASHIIGGEFYATHVNNSLFEFNLIIYRDVSGSNILDDPIPITVYENGGDSVLFTFNMPFIDEFILELGDDCFTPSVVVEQRNYQVQVDLPSNPNGYYFAWERCCRNDVISNVNSPDDWGMVFTFSMPDPVLQNSSPFFDVYPTNAYFCVNFTNTIDFSATDVNGDSLVYSLDDPLTGEANITNTTPPIASPAPYMAVPWATGFSSMNMVGGTPPMSIDPNTGVLTADPDILGVYVFAIKVEEYRDGIKIGEVRRELQFDAFVCPAAPFLETSLENVDIGVDGEIIVNSFTIEPNKPYCFSIELNGGNEVDTLDIMAESVLLDTIAFPEILWNNNFGTDSISTGFCWTPTCDDLSDEPYRFSVSALHWACEDTSIQTLTIDIHVELPEDTPTDFLLPLQDEFSYIMNGEQHCFDAIVNDVDCYDTLTFYVDSTKYIFDTSPSPGTFDPTPPSLFGSTGEFCWTPVCEDINFDRDSYALDFFVNSRKCDVINTFHYPIKITVLPETDGFIQLPNIFTPNEDASNGIFKAHNYISNLLPPDYCIENFQLNIFNRWGAEVYNSTDKFFEWDGKHIDSEEDCSPGVYYYVITYEVFGRSESYKGDITLIR